MQSILIVEDDIRALDALAYLLERDGYAVVCARNGREALDLLADNPRPGLILLDLAMPVMDGWEFRRRQRLDPALSGIPVIVISALISGAPSGVKAVMSKPIDMNKLRELIAKHISPPIEAALPTK
ncbi:MAG TPA: response regulator [Candidatus Binataceae bacterium]|nr:response regulator [Candidatus Binataceae bacterium]